MPYQNLKQILNQYPAKAVRIIGLGNPNQGDDAVGIELCKKLKSIAPNYIFHEQEKSVESLVIQFIEENSIQLLFFIDAMDLKIPPGQIQLFDPTQLDHLILSISTHKPPLQILRDIIVQHNKSFYLLGIQPKSFTMFNPISNEMNQTINELYPILSNFFNK